MKSPNEFGLKAAIKNLRNCGNMPKSKILQNSKAQGAQSLRGPKPSLGGPKPRGHKAQGAQIKRDPKA